MTYCLKVSMIAENPEVLGAPLLLELLLIIVLVFNGYQIFIYSRELKKKEKEGEKKKKGIIAEIFSWVDALLSAVIFVLLINVFLFQIYSIPSESMFPVFLVKDRPVVDKITRGPALPFTRFRVPPLQTIHRGDIVTFRNPKYTKTVESELKHLFSQFLYMVTFTGVNLDRYDEFGNEKADPLVKRVVAMPGEQIQIINDKIYIRTDPLDEFVIQEEDIHSETDLYSLPDETLNRLRYLPINQEMRKTLTYWDEQIESVDIEDVIQQIALNKENADRIRNLLVLNHLQAVKGGLSGQFSSLNTSHLSVNKDYSPLQKIEYLREDQIHFLYNLDDNDLWNRGWDFLLTDSSDRNSGMFLQITSQTDLMYKKLVSDWIVINLEYLEFLIAGSDQVLDKIQKTISDQEEALGDFLNYIIRYYDFRNLPPFPSGDVIPEDNYFLMGDNRYNSVDLRHGLHAKDRHLIEGQENSFVYLSLLHPMTINESGIEGFVVFRLFPLNRIGKP